MRTETTVRHTKCGRMRGMVVGEGGRSSGVLLYHVLSVDRAKLKNVTFHRTGFSQRRRKMMMNKD